MQSIPTSTSERLAGNELFLAWHQLKENTPNLRMREAADQLHVSEAELIAAQCGSNAIRLEADWGKLIEQLPSLGRVMALSRNDYAVHEKKGQYSKISINGMMGLVLDENIDLRIFLSQWKYGFAVKQQSAKGMLDSLQFFDRFGTAIHKIFLSEESDLSAYENLIQQYKSNDQSNYQSVENKPDEIEVETPDNEIDREGFINAWRELKDTHDFFILLKKFKVSRTQALRLAPADLAYRVDNESITLLLEKSAANDVPIMVFVGNAGIIQIHTGNIKRVKPIENWINILDEDFNLHLRRDGIASSWVVKKPTSDGIVTSLELFDSAGNNIAMLFGKRKPGIPELEDWRTLVATLASLKGN